MAPRPAELAALADKYEALVLLRSRRDSGGPEASRAQLRDLARRFPGSLRELDTLGPSELDRRARAARSAAGGGPCEPWMAWIVAFHQLMTTALLVKGLAARQRLAGSENSAIAEQALASHASRQADVPLDLPLLRAFQRPPAGRLLPLVVTEVARHFGVAPEEIQRCLFPSRRPTSASRSS